MAAPGGWQVVVHDDDVTTMLAVVYALSYGCGLTVAAAADAMRTVHTSGSARVSGIVDRERAELMVARLRVLGLGATVVAVTSGAVTW